MKLGYIIIHSIMLLSMFGMPGLYGCAPLITLNTDCDAQRKDFVALETYLAIPGDQVVIDAPGTGFITTTPSLAYLRTMSSGDSVTITTTRTTPPNPGDEAYGIFAALFFRPDDATQQWIGLLTSANGIAVGYNGIGSPFSILYRNDGVDTVVPQSSFNLDPLDGTGPSGFTLIPTNLNTYRVSHAWYGTNIIRYQLLNTNGQWITFHEITNVNDQAPAAFSNPYLPLTAFQIWLTGTNIDDRLGTNAWRAGIIHSGDNNAGIRTFDAQRVVPVVASLGEQYMFTIRNKTTFGGEPNRVMVRLSRVGGGNSFDTVTPVVIRYYKDVTLLAGAVYTDVDPVNSVVEIDTSGTVILPGHLLWMTGKAGLVFEETPEDHIEFFLGPGETITVTAENMVSASLSLYAVATWEEWQ